MKKQFFKFSLIALTVLALSACGNGQGTEAGNQAGSGDGGGKDGTYSFAF
ncbi:hypothetical protein HMSSN036_14280 [Paenibacillus macerans]|nr:hypothetical protein HMSSN036_14280 [Paenibacillus macerans]